MLTAPVSVLNINTSLKINNLCQYFDIQSLKGNITDSSHNAVYIDYNSDNGKCPT
jgi:hypothetical protein